MTNRCGCSKRRSGKGWRLAWLVVLALLPASTSARAPISRVDQANEVFTSRVSRDAEGMGPLGQEFVPELRALNMVELFVHDAGCSVEGSAGAEVKVRILRQTIQGVVLAESPALMLPRCFAGIVRFEFPKDVRLIRGDTHVIEVVPVAGHCGVYGNDRGSTYPRGRQIIQGVPQEDKDLWFREGLVDAQDRRWR